MRKWFSNCVFLALFFFIGKPALAGLCAAPGTDGDSPTAGVVNTYFAGNNNVGVGSTSLSLGSARGALSPIQAGDLLLIIQMQQAAFNRSNGSNYGDGNGDGNGYTNLRNTGRYEFARAASGVALGGGTLTLTAGTQFAYQNRDATNTAGQRRYQVIRVPQYRTLVLNGTIESAPWNGSSGGVAAIDVAGTLDFAGGNIDVSGQGFRGAGGRGSTTGSGANTDYRTPSSNLANGSKGEGIGGTPRFVFSNGSVVDNTTEGYPNGSFARGAPGNAGGGGTDGRPSNNDQNTGGGGGGGIGDGGQGGYAWCPGGPAVCSQTGGFGGQGVIEIGTARVIMGGGGGAGTTNNLTGTPGNGVASSGANGGGIIIIRAGNVSGNGDLRANGADGNQTVGNDGSGGGGAGGSIIFSSDTFSSGSISASATGGDGGSNNNSTPHGPGGGGGGGFIGLSSTLGGVSSSVSGGAPGDTDGNPAPFSANYGATAGNSGSRTTINPVAIPGFSSGAECDLLISKSFATNITTVGMPVQLTLQLQNPNPTETYSALAATDNLPAGMSIAAPNNFATTCTGSIDAAPGTNAVTLTGGSLSAGATCTINVDVLLTASGDAVNDIAPGDADASVGGSSISNQFGSTATLTGIPPLEITKTVAVINDPINADTDPYAIPGSIIEYTISVRNPGPIAIDTDGVSLIDLIPANTVYINEAISGGLSVAFDDGSPASGLSLSATNITFSDDAGATYGYTPAAGTDGNIDGVRIQPSGPLNPASNASFRFRVQVQ